MNARLSVVPLAVSDQELALEFCANKAGFEKRADARGPTGARWVTIAPPGTSDDAALAQGEFVVDPRLEEADQFTLTTQDVRAEVARLKSRGVAFDGLAVIDAPFGRRAKLRDPDGNRFVLLERAEGGK